MLSNAYRYVFVLQSYLKPFPAERPYADIKEVANQLLNRVSNGESWKLYSKDTLVYRIRQALIKDDRYLVLLISCGDKNASDPCFENFNTGKVRNADREEDEGQSYAAHMVIDLDPLISDKPINTVFLERVPGLSLTRVQMFLRHEIKQVFQKKYRDEEGKEKKYTATLELDGHASHTLREALQTGTLKNISLVEHEEEQDGHDEEDYIAEKERHVSMKIKPGITSDKAISAFEHIYEHFINSPDADDYDTMIVRVKTAQGVTKQTALELDEEEDVLSKAFYHQERIEDFNPFLESSPTAIRDDVVVKMIDLMQDTDAE